MRHRDPIRRQIGPPQTLTPGFPEFLLQLVVQLRDLVLPYAKDEYPDVSAELKEKVNADKSRAKAIKKGLVDLEAEAVEMDRLKNEGKVWLTKMRKGDKKYLNDLKVKEIRKVLVACFRVEDAQRTKKYNAKEVRALLYETLRKKISDEDASATEAGKLMFI